MPEHSVNNNSVQEALATRPSLEGVECWVFDLDNTLYPASCRLFDQVEARMNEFIVERLGVDLDEAKRLRSRLFREHGTTMNGLMRLHGVDPAHFLEHVHRIDLAHVPRDAALGAAIAALPGRKVIFTNGSVAHAENVLSHLGIDAHFDGIHDIVACRYVPKPDPSGYAAMVERFGIAPERAAMVEDMAKNLKPAAALGMATVWVKGTLDWAVEGADGDHIHYVVEELAPFLAGIGRSSA